MFCDENTKLGMFWTNLQYLREKEFNEYFVRPIFNADESTFSLNSKGNKVLALRGDKTVYATVNSNEKKCLENLQAEHFYLYYLATVF